MLSVAVICVYEVAGSVIETHEHAGESGGAVNGLAILQPFDGYSVFSLDANTAPSDPEVAGSAATRLSVVPDDDIGQSDLCTSRLQSRPSSGHEWHLHAPRLSPASDLAPGTAKIAFHILPDGTVRNVQLTSNTDNRALAQVALQIVRTTRLLSLPSSLLPTLPHRYLLVDDIALQ
jgi:TonB family protein